MVCYWDHGRQRVSEGQRTNQPRRFCGNCGIEVRSDNRFCESCGVALPSSDLRAEQTAPEPIGVPRTAPSGGAGPAGYIDAAVPFMVEKGFPVESRSDNYVTFARRGGDLTGRVLLVVAIFSIAGATMAQSALGLVLGVPLFLYFLFRSVRTSLTVAHVGGEARFRVSGNDKGGRSTLEGWLVGQGFDPGRANDAGDRQQGVDPDVLA